MLIFCRAVRTTNPIKMPKRKREDISRVDNYDAHSKDRLVAGQRAQLDTVLIHGQKILARALKIGRGFERQKLGRRQKTATKNNGGAEIAKLNQEVVALKVGLCQNLHTAI